MKKIVIYVLLSLVCAPSFGWGREGHETIAKIAENNLKPGAKKKIEKYLGGHSIVYYAKWMDDYRKTPKYKFTDGWHVAPVDSSLHYSDALLNRKKGNAIYGLEQAVEVLKNYREHDDSTVAVNIKYVLHLVGDMYCPAHIKYSNHNMSYNVFFCDKANKLHIHSVWDYAVIQKTRIWCPTEWAAELDRVDSKTRKEIAAGGPRDWMHDNAVRCEVQFDLAKPDQYVGQDFLNAAVPLIETQILYGGLRLAAILNDLF